MSQASSTDAGATLNIPGNNAFINLFTHNNSAWLDSTGILMQTFKKHLWVYHFIHYISCIDKSIENPINVI